MRALLLCLLCVVFSVSASAQTADPIVTELTRLNAQLQLATKNYDTDTLAKMITDDYELVSSSGRVYDRAAFLADAADRSAAYEINEPEDVQVRHYNDDTAIVTAVLHVRFRNGDKIVDTRIRYGDVWVKINGQWRYAYGEASPLRTTQQGS
jgi:ketosteroid isomerase-like protein